MAKISKSILVLAAVMLCVVLLAGPSIGPIAEAQPKQSVKVEHPYQDVCVLIEAFVVEVNLSQLYEQGVSPIGRKPDSVSVENILKCLDTKNIAQVTTGVKFAVQSGQRGEARITESIRVERQLNIPNGRKVPPNVRRYANYDIGETLEATASVRSRGEIFVSFDFSQNTYRDISSAEEMPPNVNRRWSGAINLQAGRPAIAGGTQNEDTAVFLILCADIKDN